MLSKMIPRYTRPQMGRIWEDQNKYQRWLDVELAVVETLADGGIIPKDAAAEIKALHSLLSGSTKSKRK